MHSNIGLAHQIRSVQTGSWGGDVKPTPRAYYNTRELKLVHIFNLIIEHVCLQFFSFLINKTCGFVFQNNLNGP